MSTSNKLKAFVRFDGSGRVVPSSVILARFKPKVGNYQEIDSTECCEYVPSPLPSNCIEFVVDTTDTTEFILSFTTSVPTTFTISWGDGEEETETGSGGFYEESHTYPQEGRQYTARICFDSPETVQQLEFYGND